VQQPDHTWLTASNLYNLYQERKTFSDPCRHELRIRSSEQARAGVREGRVTK